MNISEQTLMFNEESSSFINKVFKGKLRKVSLIISSLENQITMAEATVNKFKTVQLNKSNKEYLPALKRNSRKYLKFVKAILNGIETETLSYVDFRQQVKNTLHPVLVDFAESANVFISEPDNSSDIKQSVNKLSREEGMLSALKQIKKVTNQEKVAQVKPKDNNKELLLKNTESRKKLRLFLNSLSKLPTSLRGRQFSLVYTPIVPYMNYSVTSPEFLKKVDIEFTSIADSFVVFDNQALLIFDYGTATESAKQKTKIKKNSLASRKRSKEIKSLQENYVLDILDVINEKIPEPFILMSSLFLRHPKNNRIAFAWVAPRKLHSRLDNGAPGGLTNVKWSFPWTDDALRKL